MKYFIKTLFHGWKEVDKENFDVWCNNIRRGAVAMTEDEKEKCISECTRIES